MTNPTRTTMGKDSLWDCAQCGASYYAFDLARDCCTMGGIEPVASASAYQIGGDHYASKAVQPWDAMQAWMTQEQFAGFLRGNAIKYIARAGSKDDALQDYRKGLHYLEKLIEVIGEVE